jgi:hypothetical protein
MVMAKAARTRVLIRMLGPTAFVAGRHRCRVTGHGSRVTRSWDGPDGGPTSTPHKEPGPPELGLSGAQPEETRDSQSSGTIAATLVITPQSYCTPTFGQQRRGEVYQALHAVGRVAARVQKPQFLLDPSDLSGRSKPERTAAHPRLLAYRTTDPRR